MKVSDLWQLAGDPTMRTAPVFFETQASISAAWEERVPPIAKTPATSKPKSNLLARLFRIATSP
jgi:hypothetical protein